MAQIKKEGGDKVYWMRGSKRSCSKVDYEAFVEKNGPRFGLGCSVRGFKRSCSKVDYKACGKTNGPRFGLGCRVFMAGASFSNTSFCRHYIFSLFWFLQAETTFLFQVLSFAVHLFSEKPTSIKEGCDEVD